MVSVSKHDFDLAFLALDQESTEAWVSLETGELIIAWGHETEDFSDVPDDVADETKYQPIPSSHELDLGRPLVFTFVEERLPNDRDTVHDYFRKRGAFRRFKDLIERRGKREEWFEFEAEATERELAAWALQNGITFVLAPSKR